MITKQVSAEKNIVAIFERPATAIIHIYRATSSLASYLDASTSPTAKAFLASNPFVASAKRDVCSFAAMITCVVVIGFVQ